MDILIQVIGNVFDPANLGLIFFGVVLGSIFGCIPGLNTPIAISLCLPFSMVMTPVPTVCLFMGIYMGGVSGGLISAILLKIPGTAASIATTFDGYPMTLKGKGTEALAVGVFSSFFGGIFSTVMLLLLASLLSRLALQFGPWEYFGTAILALSMVCVLMQGKMLKGFITLGMGLLIKCVGMSPIDGIVYRFSFGNTNLQNGFSLIAIIISIFALPNIIDNAAKMKEKIQLSPIKNSWFYMLDFADIKRLFGTMLRSSFIGTFIGILPGLGGGPAGLMAYAAAKRLSKTPEEFGKGCDEGVAASESANNATTGGALIPMLSLAIPGDTSTAIIMGAFAIQGIILGPTLSLNEPVLFRTIILAVFVANIFMFLYQGSTLRFMSKLIETPKMYLMPLIMVFCVTGIFALNSNAFDLYYTLGFIVLGYMLEKNDYPVTPLLMGVILGGLVEENLRRSISNYGSFAECLKLPSIGTLFFVIAVIIPIIMMVNQFKLVFYRKR